MKHTPAVGLFERCDSSTNTSGFTLVEMAIVLVIVGFLLSGGLTILSTQQDMRRIDETTTVLNETREALIGYALSHPATDGDPYLPCPDKTTAAGAGVAPNAPNDGQEDVTVAGACVTQEGNIPWVTIGVGQDDRWSNRLRYQVSPVFSNRTVGMKLTSAGTITVRDAAAGNTIAATVPAVILSHGKNSAGARNVSGNSNPPPTGADELENTDADQIFVSHTPVAAGGAGGEFDDLVIWVSPNILFNRLVTGGVLP